ncbi:hypothetical protein [Bacillus amyloliquefaciens]|uniref:hypothetical protein n=1 Tax=Bacillus amyloliquefaciens TaxID=1390 RepID=UPI002E315E24|nr:hypothetical protein [Bacillus amyloliquefaciens]
MKDIPTVINVIHSATPDQKNSFDTKVINMYEAIIQNSQNSHIPKNFPNKIFNLDDLVTKNRIVLILISLFIISCDSPEINKRPIRNTILNIPIAYPFESNPKSSILETLSIKSATKYETANRIAIVIMDFTLLNRLLNSLKQMVHTIITPFNKYLLIYSIIGELFTQ